MRPIALELKEHNIVGASFECPECECITTIHINRNKWLAYEQGQLAQIAFPELDAVTRETIISGMCRECQEEFFTEYDDDDETEYDEDDYSNIDHPSS